jgi:hypothetical protein
VEHHDNPASDRPVRLAGPDLIGIAMSNSFREKLLTIGVISKRTRPTVVEGRAHPDSGLPFKATTDEQNNTVTEHGALGAGVSQRQDVHIRPKVVEE